MAVLLSMRKPKLSVFYVPNLLPVWGKQLAIRSLARRPHESTRSLAVGFPIAETIFFGYRMYSVLKNTCFCPKVMCSSYPRSRPTFDLQPWQRRISSELACWGGGQWFMPQPWWECCPLFALPAHRCWHAEIKSFLRLLCLKEITLALRLLTNVDDKVFI